MRMTCALLVAVLLIAGCATPSSTPAHDSDARMAARTEVDAGAYFGNFPPGANDVYEALRLEHGRVDEVHPE